MTAVGKLLVIGLIWTQLFFTVTIEASVFKFLFGGSKKKKVLPPQNKDVLVDKIYSETRTEAVLSMCNPSLSNAAAGLEGDIVDEADLEWHFCDLSSTADEADGRVSAVFMAQLRASIMSRLGSETTVLECVEVLKRKFTRLEARAISISAYISLFLDLLKSPSPKIVPDPILQELLAYIYARLKKLNALEPSLATSFIEIARIIFLDGHGRNVASIAIKILQQLHCLDAELCSWMYNRTLDLLERFPEYEQKLLQNYYLILAECPLEDYMPRSGDGFLTQVRKHYELARVYRILTFKDAAGRQNDLLRQLPRSYFDDLVTVRLFNSHLNSTGFLSTACLDSKAISARRQVFSELLHRFTPPVLFPELLEFLIEKDLLFILEGVFIYLSSMLFGLADETVQGLWYSALIGPRANFRLASLFWAYLPPQHMSIPFLDELIFSCLDQGIETDVLLLKKFRFLLLATDNLSSTRAGFVESVSWPLPANLRNHFKTEDEMKAELHLILVETVQVFLARQFGIPFGVSTMPALPAESFAWEDVVAGAQNILEKVTADRDVTLKIKF